MPTKKQILGILATSSIKFVGALLKNRPLPKVYQRGEKFGRLVKTLFPKRKRRAVENLALALPELSDQERESIADRTFENFGRAALDFLAAQNRTLEKLKSDTTILGEENIMSALDQKRGVILITGHIGNWERMSSYLSLSGYPLTVIARDADQDNVNQMVNDLRSAPGTAVVSRGNSARTVLQKLKANELVGILPDQNADDAFIPFFGHPAGTVLGPGVLSARTGAPVIPAICVYTGDNRWQIEFGEPLQPIGEDTVKGEAMMRAINNWLESKIRQHPDQWLWFHDRWRNAKRRGLIHQPNTTGANQ